METRIESLNKKYEPLSPEERVKELYKDFSEVLLTSSFGTNSVYLLHLISQVKPVQRICFLDTTYHFPETLAYKNLIVKTLNLNILSLQGETTRNVFTASDKTWARDPDLCCSINKVEPLERIKPGFEVWVSGLMRSQNANRSAIKIFSEQQGMLKFHPLADISQEQMDLYIEQNNLPVHPLKTAGFDSVGCIHCTVKGRAREGRWENKSKSECGLHI